MSLLCDIVLNQLILTCGERISLLNDSYTDDMGQLFHESHVRAVDSTRCAAGFASDTSDLATFVILPLTASCLITVTSPDFVTVG